MISGEWPKVMQKAVRWPCGGSGIKSFMYKAIKVICL